eukprot:15338161-Ditylum_brightwellii.AAC.1
MNHQNKHKLGKHTRCSPVGEKFVDPWSSNGTQWAVQIVKLLWSKFFKLWHKRNENVHGRNDQEHATLKIDRYKCTLETMYHLKDRLQTVDRQYMFQNLQEVKEFLQTQSIQYIQDYIAILYPFFKRGIQDGQKQAIQGVKPITSYFKKKTSISRSYLLPRFTSCYGGLKHDAKQRHRKYN